MKKANTKMMKEINKNIIRNIFKTEQNVTANQLSKKAGLSVVTINALLKEMINEDEVHLGESIPSNGGRPSMVYTYNDMFRCSVIIFGFTKDDKNTITTLVINLLGKCIYKETSNCEDINDNSFDDTLDKMFEKYPTIEAISFGLPGTEENGVITINDYPSIIGDTFMKHYKERYNVEVIFVNDINAAVNGYYYSNLDNNNIHTVVGVVFNRRYLPGSGIVINGNIYTGKFNFAGEIAYMPLDIDWLNLDYYNEEAISDAISKLIATISCIIAPDHFVIYGDFLDKKNEEFIKEKSYKILKEKFKVEIVVSNGFENDYEQGMIKASLEVIENKNNLSETYSF